MNNDRNNLHLFIKEIDIIVFYIIYIYTFYIDVLNKSYYSY